MVLKKHQRLLTNNGFFEKKDYQHYIKYMGSKTKIMDFVVDGINEVYKGGTICDLFAGSGSLSGAIGQQVSIHSNDIQEYSGVIARTYLETWNNGHMPNSDDLVKKAKEIINNKKPLLPNSISYENNMSLDDFNNLENSQQELIHLDFDGDWYLFTKYYSGTWWTLEQCIWIDALRQVAEFYKDTPSYWLILSSLMYAMAYTSQGTGHYAQYRNAKTTSSMKDISIYRKRELVSYFIKKYNRALHDLPDKKPIYNHKVTSLDYKDCLKQFEGGTVYADPPYCYVHYSRFYHALETLVLYDYPDIQVKCGSMVKGRYRENRHQSPFSIQSQVKDAFTKMFEGIFASNSSLVLSYSNTGMISLDDVLSLSDNIFHGKKIDLLSIDHKHMTMGRQNDRDRDVKEYLLLIK